MIKNMVYINVGMKMDKNVKNQTFKMVNCMVCSNLGMKVDKNVKK